MGRLVAYTANRTDGLLAALRYERHALRPPPTVREGAWGIAFYQGDEVLHKKRPLGAGVSADWSELGAGVSTDCALLHLREPTVGDFRSENTHPFRYRRWTFAHQGTVAAFTSMRDTLVNDLPDFLRRNLHGETDSEVFFHQVLAGLHRRSVLDSPAPPREAVVASMAEAADAMCGLAREQTDDACGVTCVVTDGHLSVGLCRGVPLFFVERRGPFPDETPGTQPSPSQHSAPLRYVVLTTGDSQPVSYEAVPQGSVVIVDRELHIEVVPCRA